LILICGLPGAGKTGLATRLASEMRAIRLCPDDWMVRLGINLWDEAIRERLEGQMWDLAQELLALGQSVILESGFWIRAERDEKRLRARELGAAVELRYLAVPLEERLRRIAARGAENPPITRLQMEAWAMLFQAPDPAELALFD
jgi:predicted kinase